jgi:hypothetical protein
MVPSFLRNAVEAGIFEKNSVFFEEIPRPFYQKGCLSSNYDYVFGVAF